MTGKQKQVSKATNAEFDVEPGFDNGPKTYWARELETVRRVLVC